MKSTAVANSNTALIKYWGKYDKKLILPMNSSISVTIDKSNTVTTVEFSNDYDNDEVTLNGKSAEGKDAERITHHLDLIRNVAKIKQRAKVVSENNFPTAVGLASSASGFAALTVAACDAADLELDRKRLSIISRQGSGSSCRSIYGGYVEWLAAKTSEKSYAIQLADENHLDLRDIVVVVESQKRKYATRESMEATVKTCPLYGARLKAVVRNLKIMEKAITEKDFSTIGKTAEFDSLLMHATAMTTTPAIITWAPATLAVMQAVQDLRTGGVECYYTIDTGAHVHIISLPENSKKIIADISKVNGVRNMIENKPGKGAGTIKNHLF